MRWVTVISSLEASDGGPPQAALGLSIALSEMGHNVVIVTHRHRSGTPHPDVEAATRAGVQIEWVDKRRPTRFQFSPGLYRAARREIRGADLAVTHSFYQWTCIAASLTARRAGVRLILEPDGIFEPYQEAHSRLIKTAFRRAVGDRVLRDLAGVAAASRTEVAGLEQSLGEKCPPTFVAGLGVTGEPRSRPDEARFASRRILFLSRIAPKKRLDKLILAARQLAEQGQPVTLVVCGDGSPALLEELRQLATGLDVEWHGHVTGGRRRQLEDSSALLCLPSDNENFGQAVTEAMAAGLPVVTSRATGASAHVEAADAGWVLDDPDPEALATCLNAALEDPEMLAAQGARATAYVARDLGWPAVARRWLEFAAGVPR
jgi:glycosyltransferase involved in cell wall biosynthesis